MIDKLVAPKISWSSYHGSGHVVWIEYSKTERYVHFGNDREKLAQMALKRYPPKIL